MQSNMGHIARLPTGLGICCSIPDLFFLPELVLGGLVWILIACAYIIPYNPMAYVISVSLFCFIFSLSWMMVFLCGSHNNRTFWVAADVAYHFLATVLYLSASVLLSFILIVLEFSSPYYQMLISAVVFSYATTVLYFIHTIFSGIRWKSF